jgi:hypothetical protein
MLGSVIRISGSLLVETHMSIGGLISRIPSSLDTANGFKLVVLLAIFCTTIFAELYGSVIKLDAPPEFE